MKTLFLDFDGVVHPSVATPKQLFAQAQMLVEPIERWRPQVVISSSWRFHFEQAEILSRLPKVISTQVIGMTGDAHIGSMRAGMRSRPIACDTVSAIGARSMTAPLSFLRSARS